MEKLPSEILCIIFSFLDKKSRKSATATCQLWFDTIRNSNLSNHICYKDSDSTDSIKKLKQRIENLEWDWKRWPALKTFEIEEKRLNEKKDLLNDLSIDFKQCPSLEIVILDVEIDIADVFSNCPRNVAIIWNLAFNPQLDIKQFGVDHIWSLDICQQNDEAFKIINENVKGLNKLWSFNLAQLDDFVCLDALLELHIWDNSPSALKIDGFKKLKTLTICNLAHLDNLVGIDAIRELSVEDVSGRELKEYDLSNIAKRFKNLQKCNIDVIDDLIQPEEYAQTVQDVFQNCATRVEIIFCKFIPSKRAKRECLTKEPFQRCVVKKIYSDDSDLDSE